MARTFPDPTRGRRWARHLAERRALLKPPPLVVEGRLVRIVGLTLETVGCQAPIGARCLIDRPDGTPLEAEVVGFSGERLFLMPVGDIHGLLPRARVLPTQEVSAAQVGEGLLGRVVDGAGRPLDKKGPLDTPHRRPIVGRPLNPLERGPIREPLDVGIRAINALLTVGRGQRMGLFAESGVGKSVLLGMMTRFTDADVIVVGLIGERGREVQEFIHEILTEEGMERAVVVAAPADSPPLMRLHGAALATSIAEYFRDRGKHVLLLMDSLTRFAQAQREIALAIGEPPATKGFPPSVFAKIPQLVERAGMGGSRGGSITAFYTVLTEGEAVHDPIADTARAILDGHVVLSRSLADAGHYPAIDVETSISRVMHAVTSEDHQRAARRFKQLYTTYQQHRDLISVGAYQAGSDPRVDEAVAFHPRALRFLKQEMHVKHDLKQSLHELNLMIPSEGAAR